MNETSEITTEIPGKFKPMHEVYENGKFILYKLKYAYNYPLGLNSIFHIIEIEFAHGMHQDYYIIKDVENRYPKLTVYYDQIEKIPAEDISRNNQDLTEKETENSLQGKIHPIEHDPIDHPKHYNNSNAKCSICNAHIECIEVTRHQSFNIGNAMKYLWRYKDKNGIEDLKKSIWYIQDQISLLEKIEDKNNLSGEKNDIAT